MRGKPRRKQKPSSRRMSSDRLNALARQATRDGDGSHVASPTAVAAELLRTGVLASPLRRRRAEIPHEDETLRVGDPDDSALLNQYVGEDVPGGSTPTPDQNDVDEIGRAYGLQEEDAGALRPSAELLERRDRHRTELRPPRRPI